MKEKLSDPYLRDQVLERVGWWLADVETGLNYAKESDSSRLAAMRMATFAFRLADEWAKTVEDAMRTYGDDVVTIG